MRDDSCQIISVYSNAYEQGKAEYAINLASALAKITARKVLFIDASALQEDAVKAFFSGDNKDPEIDVLASQDIKRERLKRIRHDYSYVIINLPYKIERPAREAFFSSDIIHFFVSSPKDRLRDGHDFLEEVLRSDRENLQGKIRIVVHILNIFDKLSKEEISWLLRRDIWAFIPEEGISEALIDSNGVPLVLQRSTSEYSKAVFRVAKRESGKLLGLALGSGAAYGLAHIGVLKVLEQNQVTIDVISGSSIGSLIASMWGLGFSSDKIERIAKRLEKRLNIVRLLDFTVPISGILAGRRLKRFLKGILGEKTFEDLQIPAKIMVYDLANRENLAIEKGLLTEAVYMSIAVPGIFEPMRIKDRMMVDGGISDPVPVDILLKEGIKKIIAVNVLPGPSDIYKCNMILKRRDMEEGNRLRLAPFYIKFGIFIRNVFRKIFTPNIFDVIMSSMQSMEYILAENSCEKANITLHPVLHCASSIDFHLVKKFIKEGRIEASSHIEAIKELALK